MCLLIVVITDLLHFLKFVTFGDKYLKFNKRHDKKVYLVSAMIIALFSVIIKIVNNESIDFFLYTIAIFIALIFLYAENVKRILTSGIWFIFIAVILDQMSFIVVGMVFRIFDYKNSLLQELLTSIISLVFVWLIGKMIEKKNCNGITNIKTYNIFMFTILAIIDAVILLFVEIQPMSYLKNTQKIVYEITFIFVGIGIFIQLAAVIILMVSRNEYKEKELMIEQYLNEQQTHYEYLEQREHETKKFRHDLKSHMHMLQNYSKNKDYETFDKYLKLINGKVDDFANRISVNNDIVDAIINKYYSEAKKNKIEMIIEGHLPRQCNISAYDLCTIFSNLLSNALEAASKSERKEIKISCRYKDEEIIITISNYYSGEVKYVNGCLQTSKHDKRIHGFGLENVEDCVEKNGGYIKINNENNVFSVNVLLKNL